MADDTTRFERLIAALEAARIDRLIAALEEVAAGLNRASDAAEASLRERRTLSPRLRAAIIEAHDSACIYCNRVLERADCVLDHVVPLALGGDDHADNLAVACAPCNTRKGARMVHDVFGGRVTFDADLLRWRFYG